MKIYILINLISLTFCFGQNPVEKKDAVHHVDWEYRYPDDGEGGGARFGPVATIYFFDGKKLGEGKDGIEVLLAKLNRCEKDKVIFYLSTRKRRGEGKLESANFPLLFSAEWTRVLWAARNRSLEIVCKNKLKDGSGEK